MGFSVGSDLESILGIDFLYIGGRIHFVGGSCTDCERILNAESSELGQSLVNAETAKVSEMNPLEWFRM